MPCRVVYCLYHVMPRHVISRQRQALILDCYLPPSCNLDDHMGHALIKSHVTYVAQYVTPHKIVSRTVSVRVCLRVGSVNM